MSPIIYVCLCLSILFSLLSFGASKASAGSILKLNAISTAKPFNLPSPNFINHQYLSAVNYNQSKQSNAETKLTHSEIESKLKKYSRQLNRNLKTLQYIFLLELDSEFIKDSKRSLDILNLKESLQREVIRNTKQINDCKAQIREVSSV